MSAALADFQGVVIAVGLLGSLVFGSWLERIAALVLCGGVIVCLSKIAQQVSFRAGDRVRIVFGPHRGSSGTVVAPLPGSLAVRVELRHEDRTETVAVHGGYQIEHDPSSGTPPADEAHEPPATLK